MGIFNRKKRLEELFENMEFIQEKSERSYLKKMAIDTVLNFATRTMSTARFRFKKNGKVVSSGWDKILNVRPNKDSSATDFWQKFFYTLMNDNEVLVINTEDDQLLIADSFARTEYAVFEDVFSDVIVKDYCFKKTFKMSDVIYLQYNNSELDDFVMGLFSDYGELFGRILEVAMRNNQIRASVSIDATSSVSDKTMLEKLNRFVSKMYNSFKTSSVAIVPLTKGFNYEEYTNKNGTSSQLSEELNGMKKTLIADVARFIGIPPALIFGENADLGSNVKAYRELFIAPMKNKLQDELNAKLATDGLEIEVYNILPKNPLDYATQADKLISSGIFTPNEMRVFLEQETKDLPELNKFYLTKNYSNLKGGETEDEENED